MSNSEKRDGSSVYYKDGEPSGGETAESLFTKPKQEEPAEQATSSEEGTGKGEEVVPAKRYFDLKSHHDKVVAELRKEVKELKAVSDTKVSEEQTKKNEMLEKFKKERPDEYEAYLAVIAGEVDPKVKQVETKLQDLEAREAKIKREEARKAIAKAHPDVNELVQSEEFHTWAESQTKEIQDWIYNNPYNAELAIVAIDLYKAKTGSKQDKEGKSQDKKDRSAEADAASLVSSRPAGAESNKENKWTRQSIKNMSVEDWEKHRKEIVQSLSAS